MTTLLPADAVEPLSDLGDLPLLASVVLHRLSAQTTGGLDDIGAVATALRPIFDDARRLADAEAAKAAARIGRLTAEVEHLEEYAHRLHASIQARIEDGLAVEAQSIQGGFDPFGWFVYLLWGDDNDRPVYVGKSGNVLARLGTHVNDHMKRFRHVTLLRCKNERHMTETESRLIAKYQPRYNIAGVRNDLKETA